MERNATEMDRMEKRRNSHWWKRNYKILIPILVLVIAAILLILTRCIASHASDNQETVPETPVTQTPVVEPENKEEDPPQTPDVDSSDEPVSNVESSSGSRTYTGDWRLVLVNPWNKLPENWDQELVTLDGGWRIDSRCSDDLIAMLNDCRASGASPLICSAFRTQEMQESLFANTLDSFLAQGYGADEARKLAARDTAVPGTSEHQLGLAVDIVDASYQQLNDAQERTAAQLWLTENSWRYGFILRYPNDKTDVTGIIYEPWHYRYVGKEYAKDIYEKGVCLEEYLSAK